MKLEKLKVYIAAPLCDKRKAKMLRKNLFFATIYAKTELDFVATWLDSNENSDCDVSTKRLRECAVEALMGIHECDVLLQLVNNEVKNSGNHVELGYALALGKRCLFMGERCANAFHYLDTITYVHSFQQLRCYLEAELGKKRMQDAKQE